jgi:hypothetical protein
MNEMKIKVEKYVLAKDRLPIEGRHILGHQQGDEIVVYQAYGSLLEVPMETCWMPSDELLANKIGL